jgi:hypothetical protein
VVPEQRGTAPKQFEEICARIIPLNKENAQTTSIAILCFNLYMNFGRMKDVDTLCLVALTNKIKEVSALCVKFVRVHCKP